MGLHLLRFVHRGQTGLGTHFHQIARHFRLAIDHHTLAARQLMQVDAMALAAKQQLNAVMGQTFSVHALGSTGFFQQVYADLLQHTCTDTAQHVVAAALLQDDVVNASLVQQLTQQQTGRACTHDDDGGTHLKSP